MEEADIYWKQKPNKNLFNTDKNLSNEGKSTHPDYIQNLVMCRTFIGKVTPHLIGNMRIYLSPDPGSNINLSHLNISLLMMSSKDTRSTTIGHVFCDHLDLNNDKDTFSRKLEHVFNQHLSMVKKFNLDKNNSTA